LLMALPRAAVGQGFGQEFLITPAAVRITVGDSVTIRFRVRLDERDLLLDTVPQPVSPLATGVRILSIEKLRRSPDRIFHGQARLAFYRSGRQPVPVFGLPFMRIVEGVRRATLASDSAFVNVLPVLPAGNPPLKDIREPDSRTRFPWSPVLAGALLFAGLLGWLRKRRRHRLRPTAPRTVRPVLKAPKDFYTIAQESLTSIEREEWPAHGQVARHYQAVVDVLRVYLESAESVPARERTTGEILWDLPPHFSQEGIRERFRELLEEADLVKFARYRPDEAAARRFLEQSRSLLSRWHAARVLAANESVDALR
jgi:hypothetical protein